MSAGRRLLVVLAVLVPLALAGGLVWLVTSGDRTSGPGAPSASGAPADGRTPSAAPPSGPDAPAPGGDRPPGASPSAERPLAGRVVVLDPGHNPGNRDHTAEINRQVDIGTGRKECDTTGTASDAGYPEADFTLDLARRTRAVLREQGAEVRFTQEADVPFGPCIDERAAIGNRANADAVVSLHADGSARGNRGFHVILPAEVRQGDADTRGITAGSRRLGEHLADRFAEATGTRPAGYLGPQTADSGLVVRGDLGGLNLSRVPKVFLECGNMRDPRDAALLSDPAWRQRAARGVAAGVTAYLTGNQ
ncbi:N-acetylmuramoyl-L-alanine amidase [Streptomyces sp. 549]|uniref:N-acetylmuramoyl-L-alanine amidase n=1 Tax=Streptomyces sp. 549 TaxID=3049076 RepID=UPI0024C28785|nr:N-acetylmuramoyl-L-alanine amidase [Streptomyces sp. 549]MDK1474015.1 N-acetylmuramoyl-L-alanine amidase [Streptomyces sp. 549]